MRLLKGMCACFAFLLSLEASAQDMVCAIPPAPKPITITQPDGSILKVVAKGSPFLHWQETTDGYTIVKNRKGIYEYAEKRQGKLLPSGIQAVDPDYGNANARRSFLNIEKHLKPDTDSLAFQQMRGQLSPFSNNARLEQSNAPMPPSGNIKVLCILIEYPDLKHAFPKENFAKLMNGSLGDGRLSFAEFYTKSSFGKLNLKVDVAGWYKAKDKYATYGNDGSNSTSALVAEAVDAANKDGVDFSQYDNNKDGIVDGLIVVHAGPGGEEGLSSQYIWSHMSYISKSVDGVYVRPYCINPEVRNGGYGKNGMVGMGIFAHEFGHLLGLPDLYDTNGGSEGIGEWGLMGSGNWLGMENEPAGFSAWSKEKLGWISPKDITEDFKEFILRAASEFPEAYKIRTANPNEYFLLENRQQTGVDSKLNGHGLAIWHINTKKTSLYPTYNTVNGDASNKGVDLEEADGSYDLDNGWNRSDNSDLFPADYYQLTLFDYSTDPSSELTEKYGSSRTTGISVGDIKENKKTVNFTYRRDTPDIGEDCENPATAIAGENLTPQLNYFFEYTMPKDGTLYVSVDDPELVVGGTIYSDCKEVDQGGGTNLYLDGSSRFDKVFKIDFVKKGERLIFSWEYNLKSDLGEEESFKWNLAVETGGVSNSDSLALVALYKEMGGNNWYYNKNWLKKPVSSWEGVTVKNGRVSELNLFDLQKSIPVEFYNLNALESLSLQSQDNLTGIIDDRITNFKQLKILSIDTRGLEVDFIDKLNGSLAKLKDVEINVYKVNGELPNDINKMSALENLTVTAKVFKSKIPESIGSITKLTSLTLSGELYGSIPESLGNAVNLRFINLSFNKLTGKIPESLAKLNNLEYVNLQNNQLSGSIPSGLFNLPYLSSFYADHNKLESIPENFFSSEALEFIDISYNQVKGSLPQSVSGKTIMDMYAYLSHNQLTGEVPEGLKKISFAYLDLSYNQLKGQLPKINYLEGLDISYNQFTGLPDLTEDSDEYYKMLYCQHNYLSFDDFIPNLSILLCPDCGYDDVKYDEYNQFRPQDPVNLNITQAIGKGSSYTIKLGIDENVKDNEYRWFKDGKLIKTTKKNELTVENFTSDQVGKYRCEVTNAKFKDFVLYYEGIELRPNDRKEQNITIAAVDNKKYGDPAFRLKAESTGLKEIEYEVVEGPVQIVGDTVKIEGTGKAKVRAYNKGNDQFNPAEAFVEFTISKAPQQITYKSPTGVIYGQEDFLLDVQSSSQLPVTLTLKEGNAKVNGKLISVIGAGKVKIMAKQEGSNNFYPAEPIEIIFEVAKAAQQITVADVADQTYGAPPFEVEAVSSLNLPIKLEALTDNISVDENVVTILKAGAATLKATQEGNADIQAAEPVTIKFNIAKASQLLYFQQVEDKLTTDESFELQAYSNKGLPVSYKIIDGEDFIKLEGGLVTILNAGSVQIEAHQDGDENHEPAEPMLRGFTILDANKATQTITVQAEIPDTVRRQESYTFLAETSSGLTPEITIEGPAELQGDQLVFLEKGFVKVIVKQNGSEEFNAAPTIVKEYVVIEGAESRLEQTITFTPIEDKVYGDEPFEVNIKASSGLPVNFRIEGPAQIEGNTITLTGAGTVKLIFYQEGNEDFQPTKEETISFEVAKAPQSIDFEIIPVADTSYYLQGSCSSQLSVSYQVTEGKGKITNDTLYVDEPGLVTVQAMQEGNENYLAAEPVSRTVDVKIITGVEEDMISLIKVYPNPSSSTFYLDAHDVALNTKVQVYSTDGKIVSEHAWQGDITEIDLTGKPQGVYFVRFTHKGKLFSVPVILKW